MTFFFGNYPPHYICEKYNKSVKMRTLFKLLALCVVAASLTSCATLFGSSKYPVAINSTPEGAGVTIENHIGQTIFEGTTPATVKLKSSASYLKKAEYKITFTKNGYERKVIFLTAELNGWYIGNIFLGGLPGMLLVDPLSGAMYKIADEDRSIHEKLTPVSTELSIQVHDINKLPSNISKESLVRIN